MLRKILFTFAIYLVGISTFAQYSPQWHSTFGGSGNQIGESLIEISDGNFLLIGSSFQREGQISTRNTFANNSSIVDVKRSKTKLLVTKFDPEGSIIWEKQIGNGDNQFGNSVIEVENGNFIITGASNDRSNGYLDLWIVKISSQGEKVWEHNFGKKGDDRGNSIIKTSDKGFIVAGQTQVSHNISPDIWVLKFDRWGVLSWEKTFGGQGYETANSIIEAQNGDFVVLGATTSIGKGRKDINLFRLDKFGTQIWNTTFGERLNDVGYELVETKYGDIVLVGNSQPTVTGKSKNSQAIVIKTNSKGVLLWDYHFKGEKRSTAYSLVEMENDELAIAGFSASQSTGYDVQISIINTNGDLIWKQIYGGVRWDEANSIIRTSDNNLLLTGYTKSHISNECDVWTLLLKPDITPGDVEYAEITTEEQIFCSLDSEIPSTNTNGMNTLAVIIGLEHYKYAHNADYAAHDAAVFYKYAKSVFGIPDRNILFMTNEDATSAEFKKAFMKKGWLDKRSDENTNIIVYYAGHAYPDRDPRIDEAYLIPYDVDANYADLLGIGINQLIKNLGELNASSTTIFFDACFTSLAPNFALRDAPIDKRIAYNANVNLLFASDKNETAMPLREKNHGLFTYYLLKGLQGEACGSDSKITIEELYNYIRAHVSKEAGFLDGEQTPQLISTDKKKVLVDFN